MLNAPGSSTGVGTRRRRTSALIAGLGCVLLAGLGIAGVPAVAAGRSQPSFVQDPAALVNPFIGTGGGGNDFPGADAPFGMVQWSPDTPSRPAGGGYAYGDHKITGFSLDHLSGPGCSALGDVPILPTTGRISSSPSDATLPLDHHTESAHAGAYHLRADGITTDLTATPRSGMAWLSFPRSEQANLLFKLNDSARVNLARHFTVVNNHEVSGWLTGGDFCDSQTRYDIHFDMIFDRSFASAGIWHVKGHPQRVKVGTSSRNIAGGYVSFKPSGRPLVAKVGVSYVSIADARQNRAVENPGWYFGKTERATQNAWNRLLDKIQIAGGTATQRTVFETALYHSLLNPNVFSDVNGRYLGFDHRVHTAPRGHAEYANFSGWDIYRSQIQLAALIAPQQISDVVRSMLDDYAQTGEFPKWSFNGSETYVMVGDPADAIIADAYTFGARAFDARQALSDMRDKALHPNPIRPGLRYYEQDGYLPVNGHYGCCRFYGAVSTQLEYDSADYAISALATELGKPGIAGTFARRANNWQNVFNPDSGYLQAKNADGSFAGPAGARRKLGFIEGNSTRYTPMEPFDIAGIASAVGGDAQWVARLNTLTADIRYHGSLNSNFGNEPSLEVPWEYDYVGAPYRTQAVVRRIQQVLYTDQPAGLGGNDDLGEISSWYVFSALGLYPETPGSPVLALGSPVFDRTVLHLPSGKTLRINAPSAAVNAPYVSRLSINGRNWTHAYLPFSLARSGGTVSETLTSTPNTAFGSAAQDAPPSSGAGLSSVLGYSDHGLMSFKPSGTRKIVIGSRNLTSASRSVSWSAKSGGGFHVSSSHGSFAISANGRAQSTLAITAPSARGSSRVRFTFSTAGGPPPPPVVVDVRVSS